MNYLLSFILKKFVHYFGNFLRSLNLIYLRMNGVTIGKGGMISLRTKIDTRRGKIIIGNNCEIAYGVIILAHDASAKRFNPSDHGEGKVIIEDNAFIGVNSIILRNVTIGKNSIIGAGSVVSRDIPPNVVAIGNPARVTKEVIPPKQKFNKLIEGE